MSGAMLTRFGLALALVALGFALGHAVSPPAAPPGAQPEPGLPDPTPVELREPTRGNGSGDDTDHGPLAAALPDSIFGVPTKDAPTAGNGVADDEWKSFPRKDIDVVWTLSHKPSSLSASDIYRSTQLNPADVVVPEPARRVFEKALSAYQSQLDVLYKEFIGRRHRELRDLAVSGRLLSVNGAAIDGAARIEIQRTVAALSRRKEIDASVMETALIGEELRKQGLRVLTFEGRALYLPRGLRLESSSLVDAYADAVHVFTFGVLSWFGAFGALQPDDLGTLSRRLDECVEDVRARYG